MKHHVSTKATISNMSTMARAAHEAGGDMKDITNSIYTCFFRSAGMEPGMEAWSIEKTKEAIRESGIGDEQITHGLR